MTNSVHSKTAPIPNSGDGKRQLVARGTVEADGRWIYRGRK